MVIRSNDTTEPVKKISVTAMVKPKREEMHKQVAAMHGSYFEGKCANCHVEQGIGKMGKALFEADCAMCHGGDAAGVSGLTVPLNNQNYLATVTDQQLYMRIADGTGNPMMLGFSEKNHGPLDEEQIRSLVEYIRSFQVEKVVPNRE